MPKTKIICTLGPASSKENVLIKMMGAGMGVARLNFSHSTLKVHLARIRLIRKLNLLSPAIHGGVMNSPIRGDSNGIASPWNKRYSDSRNYHERYEITETVLTGAKSPAIHGGEYLLIFKRPHTLKISQ